jgi:hypothetical protein
VEEQQQCSSVEIKIRTKSIDVFIDGEKRTIAPPALNRGEFLEGIGEEISELIDFLPEANYFIYCTSYSVLKSRQNGIRMAEIYGAIISVFSVKNKKYKLMRKDKK